MAPFGSLPSSVQHVDTVGGDQWYRTCRHLVCRLRLNDLMDSSRNVIDLYLEGARVVVDTIADPEVAEAWNRSSVLEEQTVGSLVGHLARGGVWLVAHYLDRGVPSGPVVVDSAPAYFAKYAAVTNAAMEQAIRDRGTTVAAPGHAAVVQMARSRLAILEPRLRGLSADQRLSAVSGWVMHLGDYLVTRIVEQVVHLDDLARSLGRDHNPVPEDALALAVSVGLEVARIRSGEVAVLRAVYRDGFAAGTFPVL